MNSVSIGLLLLALASTSMAAHSQDFELATAIDKSQDEIALETRGYAKLNLIRIETNHKGKIFLKGSISVANGEANVVMWSRVQGKYYFTKLPGLQGFASNTYQDFAIPFSSPEQPISEVLINVELPNGGRLIIKNLDLIKG